MRRGNRDVREIRGAEEKHIHVSSSGDMASRGVPVKDA